jgi:SEC-C motif domain protein
MNPKAIDGQAPCPCGGARYAACCGRFHAGPLHLQAPTAEALMRSRYSAYVLELGAYLQDTWHPSTCPAEPPHFEPGLKWLGLDVKRHAVIDETHAVVEFTARSKLGGRAHRLHESSRFEVVEGRWFYLDGEVS